MAKSRLNAVGPCMIKRWVGKSVGGFTFVERTAETRGKYYLWKVRCDACRTVQAGGENPARLTAAVKAGTRRLCENPDCPASVKQTTAKARARHAAILAVVEAGGDGQALATRLGMTRERARQILDEVMPEDQIDSRLAAATREQLLASVLKRPLAQRRLIAVGLEFTPEGD